MITNIGQAIKDIETQFLKKLPDFKVGDNIKMFIKVAEGDKIRNHPFEGTVIRKTGRGIKGTFTVRKTSFGEGVERTFPLSSPMIDSFKVVARGIKKRSKLYYLRGRTGKSSRIDKEAVEKEVVTSS